MAITMTNLKKLLGDDWVEQEVIQNKHSHPLGRCYKADPDSLWLKYVEGLVGEICSTPAITLDQATLAVKLKPKDGFVSTLSEIETALFLAKQRFAVTIEPLAPNKGPDFRADWHSTQYFVEVRTVGLTEQQERRDDVSGEIFAKLKTKPSSYTVHLNVGRDYKRGEQKLKDAIETPLSALDLLNGAKEGKLYFAAKDEAVLLLPGAYLEGKAADIAERSDFIAEFAHAGKMLPETRATFIQPMEYEPHTDDPNSRVPKASRDHIRLRRILDEKRDQLPKGSRGIIVLEVSDAFMLSDFSVDTALYGDRLIHFAAVKGPDEPVGEAIESRNRRGFLLHTSRVSAVVIQRRRVENGAVVGDWRVYPTNRLDADTIRLTLEELQRFGDVDDRKHLSAENAPKS